jgi:hypothetical protein
VYAPVREASSIDSGTLAAALRRSKGNLLATKIDDLLAAVEQDQFERVLQETKAEKRRAKLEEKREKAKSEAEEARVGEGSEGPTAKRGEGDVEGDVEGRRLWVEKYAPVGFLDLLSDELINREVVKWVKTWDRCVFGNKSGATPKAGGVEPSTHSGAPSRRLSYWLGLLGWERRRWRISWRRTAGINPWRLMRATSGTGQHWCLRWCQQWR